MTEIILIAHEVRSLYNIGAICRTAEALKVSQFYCTGTTPYWTEQNDSRLPHVIERAQKEIHKTALGAEVNLPPLHQPDIFALINMLKAEGYIIAALEQTRNSVLLPDYQTPNKIALIVGTETIGLDETVLAVVDTTLEIPMYGAKESFNVSAATAIALYEFRRQENLGDLSVKRYT